MLDSFPFVKRIEVRFRDCDSLGHVNNAVFATYFEVARFAYFHEGLGYRSREGFPGFIIARLECNFRSQARMGDVLDAHIRVTAIGRTSFTFEYRLVQTDTGRLVADGRSVQVMFDYETQKPVPVPDHLVAQFERLEHRTFPRPVAHR
jgi:acyl-CoA thioester hydrolase